MANKKHKPTAEEMEARRLFRRATPFVVIVIALLTIIGWVLFSIFHTYPLGDKLEYIGKQDYGCYRVCASESGSTYYYGTDLTPEQVVAYFVDSKQTSRIRSSDGTTDFSLQAKDGKTFHIYIYDPKTKQKILPETSKHYVLSIDYSDYERAKDSL